MATTIRGIGASSGVAIGPIVRLPGHARAQDLDPVMSVEDALAETARRFGAMEEKARAEGRSEEADIMQAYALLVEDRALRKAIAKEQDAGVAPAAAVSAGGESCALQLAALEDEYFSQRADDVRAVARHAVKVLVGLADQLPVELPQGAIVCAHDLSPADTLHLDVSRLGGIATEVGGPTSHTAIVARSLRIPAVVGAGGLVRATEGHDVAVLDGDVGEVVLSPDEHAAEAARAHQREIEQHAKRYERMRGRQVRFGGRPIAVAANVGGMADVDAAREAQADGIGLFRSEFLFSERDDAPELGEQAEAYRHAVTSFEHPVVIRTLDVGGDKPLPYLNMPPEDNPFLGIRGLRLCLQHRGLFERQLDALCLAGTEGQLRVMFPMVATVDDFRRAKQALQEAAERVGVPAPPAGIMVETPAAVMLGGHLGRQAAFFSIGTNDLAQYSAGADRTSAALGHYQDPLQPHLLRLVAMTVDAARSADIPVAVCGEAAGDPRAALLLVGLGVDEVSVAAALVDEIRWTLAEVDPQRCERAARAALEAPDVDAVREVVADVAP